MTEIPRFQSEDEERAFWATHDSVNFLEGAEQVNLECLLASAAECLWIVRYWELRKEG